MANEKVYKVSNCLVQINTSVIRDFIRNIKGKSKFNLSA